MDGDASGAQQGSEVGVRAAPGGAPPAPFELLGVHSDNGGEFINAHLQRYCEQQQIDFTRSRAHRKNDNNFTEQKNFDVVRKHVGYARYDTPKRSHCLTSCTTGCA